MNFKKTFSFVLTVVLFFLAVPGAMAEESGVSVMINGIKQEYDQPPALYPRHWAQWWNGMRRGVQCLFIP